MKEFILKYKWVLFFSIVLINFGFKFYKVGGNSLWLDECYTVQLAQKPISEIINIALVEEPNPPLYGIVMHYWIKLFGISETGIRSFSVFVSSLAAGVLFLLCLRFFNWQTSLFSTFMYFTSNEIYYYGQEARTYAMILLLAVLSYYLFLSLTERPNLLNALLLALVNAFIFYSHLLACFLLVGQLLMFPVFILNRKTKNEKNKSVLSLNKSALLYFITSGLILIGMLFPWKNRLMFLMKEGGKAMWLGKPVWADFKNCVYDFFNGELLFWIQLSTFCIFIVLLIFKKFRTEDLNWKVLLLSIISGPGLLLLNYTLASHTPIFLKRYVLFTSIGFILTYAYLFSLLNFNFTIKLVLFLLLSIFSFSKMVIPRESLNDYNTAVPYLKNRQKHRPVLIINDLQDQFAYYYDREISKIDAYHLRHQALRKKNVYTTFNQTWPDEEDFSMYREIYYTRSFFGFYDPQENIPKKLALKYNWIEDINKFKGIKISHYINPNYNPK